MADEAFADTTTSSQDVGESSQSTFEINIKTLDSQIYKFVVNKDMLVSTLKEKIVDATGVPVEQQRLIFRGRVLKDDHPLSVYHLENEHTLHLVVRQPAQTQPSPAAGSEAQNSGNQGNEPIGAPHSRIGQISHSVVLGTMNIAEPGEGIVPDIGQLIGAVLNSIGLGMVPTGGAGNNSISTSNQDIEGTQNARSQPVNPAQSGFTIPNHRFQPLLPRLTAVPDSLTTLSEVISRLNLAIPQAGSQSSPSTDVQDPPRFEVPSSSSRGVPTPEVLCAVIERVRQFLTSNVAAALSNIATGLERESASTDPMVRSRIQSETIHTGQVMHHLGAMFLELSRTMMSLRMGQSPAEALVNAGQAVYISPVGANPIMVQPSSLQIGPLFGAPPPFSGPLGSGDPSRNVSIHIHTGVSVPGASSTETRTNSGESIRRERPNVEQVTTTGNNSSDPTSTLGLTPRTIVTAIPARSGAETNDHVHNVIIPVHVRSQLSVPIRSASPEAPRPIASSGTQAHTTNPAPVPSLGSSAPSTLVAQINAQIASMLVANNQGQSPSPSVQFTDTSSSRAPQLPHEDSIPSDVGADVVGCRDSMVDTDASQRTDGPQLSQGGLHCSTIAAPQENPVMKEYCTTSSETGPTTNQSTSITKPVIESSNKHLESVAKKQSSLSSQESGSDRPAPLGLGLGGLKPKRRGKLAKAIEESALSQGSTSIDQTQQSISRGQQVLQSLVSQVSDRNGSVENGTLAQPPSFISDIMGGMPLGGQGASGPFDGVNMIGNVLQSPAINNLLSGVAEQDGIGSTDALRNMLEQVSRNPGVMNTLNGIVQQVGQNEGIGGMLSGLGRGNAGMDFSRIIQQMVPVVSQALGRASTLSSPSLSAQSEPPQCHNVSIGETKPTDAKNSQINVQQAVERIEHHDSPGNVFRAVLESAASLLEEGNNSDLIEGLGNDTELADDFMEMMRRRMGQRLQKEDSRHKKPNI